MRIDFLRICRCWRENNKKLPFCENWQLHSIMQSIAFVL
jgi:hypothetical protein